MDEFDKLNRAQDDFYATPPEATKALLNYETFAGNVLEPASGDGAMSRLLENRFNCVYSSDIRKTKNIHGNKGLDFLRANYQKEFGVRKFDNIITNPPFILAMEFIQRAKEISKNKIAFILRLQFLESEKRYSMFIDKNFPLAKILVFSKRVIMLRNGELDKTKNKMAFAWYIWDREYKGRPEIDWIL